MSDTVAIVCPECAKRFSARAEVVGKKVKCKGCGAAFVAEAAPLKAAPSKPAPTKAAPAKGATKAAPKGLPPAKAAPARDLPPPDPDEEEDENPYGITEERFPARCPHCAHEMESDTAIICLNCGYNTQTREMGKTRKVRDQTFGDQFLWLLPGILCVLGILILILGNIFYDMKIEDYVERGTWYGDLLNGGAIKMWMGIISVFMVFLLGRFALKRLILDNKPPEIEKN